MTGCVALVLGLKWPVPAPGLKWPNVDKTTGYTVPVPGLKWLKVNQTTGYAAPVPGLKWPKVHDATGYADLVLVWRVESVDTRVCWLHPLSLCCVGRLSGCWYV